MLPVVVRIVSIVGIPDPGEKIALPRDRAALHMYSVDEAVFYFASAPVAAPDEPAAVRELAQEGEVTFPATLPGRHAHDVTSQSIVMNSNRSKFCSPVIEELLLAVLAAVGFVDHDFNSHLLRGTD